jgi:glutamate--cysteine ligase catalytic subunit
LPVSIDQKSFDTLRAAQVDEKLARHIAHLFIRDPLVIYKERIEIDNAQNSDHFENIQSTNWQTVRFKPPPPNSPIGWRVEFRSMEIQLTDFENAAFAVFITLVSRAILFFHLNLYMPISKVDENLKRAHSRNAVNREKFFFRRHIRRSGTCAASVEADDDSLEEMSIADIFVGKSVERPGLIPLVQCYLDIIQCDVHTRAIVENYISLVRDRALGKLQTAAEYMRAFIREHPDYQLDSIITSKISRDLIERCDQIAHHRFEVC